MRKGYIYQIRNRATGKLYVGSTLRPNKRKLEHFNSLRKGIHCNRKLQNAWNKYGEENFEYSILEVVADLRTLQQAEDRWISNTKSRTVGYNILTSAALCNPESIDLRRIRLQISIGKAFRSRPPSSLKKISKEEWIENRLRDQNFKVSIYKKKGQAPRKKKTVLQLTLDGGIIKEYSSVIELPDQTKKSLWKSLNKRPANLTHHQSIWILKEIYDPHINFRELLQSFDLHPKAVPRSQILVEPYIILRSPTGEIHSAISRKEASQISGITPARIAQLKLGYKIKNGHKQIITKIKGWEVNLPPKIMD